jgi:hypothetical protein
VSTRSASSSAAAAAAAASSAETASERSSRVFPELSCFPFELEAFFVVSFFEPIVAHAGSASASPPGIEPESFLT